MYLLFIHYTNTRKMFLLLLDVYKSSYSFFKYNFITIIDVKFFWG